LWLLLLSTCQGHLLLGVGGPGITLFLMKPKIVITLVIEIEDPDPVQIEKYDNMIRTMHKIGPIEMNESLLEHLLLSRESVELKQVVHWEANTINRKSPEMSLQFDLT
jgi:hypothetical protein